MFQDLHRFNGGGHGDGLHPALHRNRGTGIANRLLVIHDEDAHRENLVADSCFLTHDRDHESLQLVVLSAPHVPFQETILNLFINKYISQMTTYWASPSSGRKPGIPSHSVSIREEDG